MNDTLTTPKEAQRIVAGKYLTFTLNEESFAIDVLKVREIIRTVNITVVPQMPAHVRGVINLRGRIIPVIDLRLRFGFPETENTDHTCIIVVQVKCGDRRQVQMGIVVDDVEEVVNIGESEIEETPHFGSGIVVDNIIGMAKVKGAVKALLNIDRILGTDEAIQAHAF
jgi:purine-binding chemotaxis protein CheW